ncbi:MAG: hypothetical protein A2Y12_14325 [Planctomycetes bacterium GWF2_42_9]|nr:MAG: hypothetical protein A2Y12_14325 [Planctomycetes bacterium GWF2_42_9]HAL45813.1 hypothetical protein [Phycisphaerales bacterium]
MSKTILRIGLILGVASLSFAGSIDSPIAHWAFDEVSGTIASDSAGSYNGTVSGATWTAGKIGGALSFDGVNDYVNCGDIDAVEFGSSNFTVAYWFNISSIGAKSNLVSKYNIYGRQWLSDLRQDGSFAFATYSENNTYSGVGMVETTAPVCPVGQWIHCVTVRQGSQMYLYLDGSYYASGNCYGTLTGYSTPVTVGALLNYGSPYNCFTGLIDDVRIYNYALSANEVAELYTIPEPTTIGLFGLAGLLSRIKRIFQ